MWHVHPPDTCDAVVDANVSAYIESNHPDIASSLPFGNEEVSMAATTWLADYPILYTPYITAVYRFKRGYAPQSSSLPYVSVKRGYANAGGVNVSLSANCHAAAVVQVDPKGGWNHVEDWHADAGYARRRGWNQTSVGWFAWLR